jgi:Na+-driven multidrug efflux pump
MVNQSFFSLFITFSLIELSNVEAGICDGLIVGNFLNDNSLAAVGLSSPMFSISGIICGLFATGMQTMCAQELGRGDIKSLNRVFSSVFYIAGVVSVIIMSVELIFAKQLAYLFGATGEGIGLAVLATDYIRGLAIGFPALVLTVIVASGCQLDSGRKRVMKATIIYCGSNIAFDILAIVLNTGEFGIGLATALGAYVELCYLMLHFRTKDRMLHFTKFRISFNEVIELMSL